MVAENHFKNGMNLKSLTNKENNVKRVVFLFVLICISVGMWAQSKEITKIPETPTSTESIKLFGKIKSVKEIAFDASEKFGEVVKGEVTSTTSYFLDKNKNLIEYRTGEIKVISQYNDKGKVIKSEYYNPKGVLDSMFVWKRENEKITKDKYSTNNTLLKRDINKFDNVGNKTETSKYNSKGDLISKEMFKYNGKN